METIEATVGEGGVLHLEGLPFAAGKRLKVTLEEEKPAMTQAEWVAHVRRHAGTLSDVDFDLEDQYPEPIEPLFLSKEES